MAHQGSDHEISDLQMATPLPQDPNSVTIEFLRARLLAERAVSKSAREKVDELAKKVVELEEQLKFVSLRRKKAEMATAEVLAILEENGFTDVSETYDSSSDQESFSQTNSASGRRISWKGRRSEPISSDKFKESHTRRQRSFESVYLPSPRGRQGKSCRKIKRRESRSMAEDSYREGNAFDHQESVTNDSEMLSGEAPEFAPNAADLKENGNLQKNFSSNCLGEENNSDINLERAIENRAHVIGCFEDLERTQREWEEKFRESNIFALDLCDPGNHSDVTDESSENKTEVQHQGDAQVPSVHEATSKTNIADSAGSCQIPSHVLSGNSETSQDKHCQTCVSNFVDEGFSSHSATTNYIPEFPNAECCRPQSCSSGFLEHSSSPSLSALVSQSNLGSSTIIQTGDYTLVPVAKENSSVCDTVLTALRQVRLSLQEKVNSPHRAKAKDLSEGSFSSSSNSRINTCTLPAEPVFGIKAPFSASEVGCMAKVPVGCAGLFRVPTDFSSDPSMRSNYIASSSKKILASYVPERGIPVLPRDYPITETSIKSVPDSGFQSHLVGTAAPLTAHDRLPTTPYIGGSKLWTGFSMDDPLIGDAQCFRLYKSTTSVSDSRTSSTESAWEGSRANPTSFSLHRRPNTFTGTPDVHLPSTSSQSSYHDPTQLSIERFSTPYTSSLVGLPPIGRPGNDGFGGSALR